MNSFPCLFINSQASVFISPVCLPTNNHWWRNRAVRHLFSCLRKALTPAAAQELPGQNKFWQEKQLASTLSSNLTLVTLAVTDSHYICPGVVRACPAWLRPGLLLIVSTMPGESSKALAGAEWCIGGSWQQFSTPVPNSDVLPRLPWESSCCPELSPAFCNALRPRPQHQTGHIPSPAKLGLTFMTLCLHQLCFGCIIWWTVGKQTVPLYVHQVPGVGGQWLFR